MSGDIHQLTSSEYSHCINLSPIRFTQWSPHPLYIFHGTVTDIDTTIPGINFKVFRSTDLDVWTDISDSYEQFMHRDTVEMRLEFGSTFASSGGNYKWPKWESAYYIVQPNFYPDPEGTR
ncbi:hypothetical protein [Rubritalea tangerina]|uniref:hypothetical protein n=1 Tax=Rubritalea tangerina TaxID=430798 RepID=UPI003611A465